MRSSLTRHAILAALCLLTLGLVAPAPAGAVTRQGRHPDGHGAAPLPHWSLRPVATTQQFRGLDAVSRRVAWVAGSEGGVFRTVDAGRSWADVSPSDAAGLALRDVEAFDRNHAIVLAIGEGDESRVYRTADGGLTWARAFTNDDPAAFYDCMTFFDRRHGLALSDPVDGRFRIIATRDGGRTWQVRPNDGMPAAVDGEFAFAASGTCLTSHGHRKAWFGTGGGAQARVFRTHDRGWTWHVSTTPMRSSDAGGIFSLAFRDRRHGLAIGGDFTDTGTTTRALSLTSDGGRTWRLVADEDAPKYYRSGSAFVPRAWWGHDRPGGSQRQSRVAIAVGPTGSDISWNGGHTWTAFDADSGGFDSVECAADGACWASERNGKVALLVGLHNRARHR